jgi:hypothetical protein
LKSKGCYAEGGPLAIHWGKVSNRERGTDWSTFCSSIARLPKGQLWRYGQAGDLPGNDEKIDGNKLKMLVKVNKRKRGFAYTHKPLTPKNVNLIHAANEQGFTINVSANSPMEATELLSEHNLPTVTVLPIDAPNVQHLDGFKIVACPAEKSDKVNCSNCALCADSKRDYIIGFRAHGSQAKKVENLIYKG